MTSGVSPILETSFADLPLVRRGKVRDVYQVDAQRLLIVATDRISAFDCISPTPVARKGEVLTQISRFWFERLASIVPHHLVTTEVTEMPAPVQAYAATLAGRAMLVKRTEVFPVECVVRGYLSGSGWKDYQATGEVCGHKLPSGLRESDQLPEAIFTPATKAESGHDENISTARMAAIIGTETTARLRDISLQLYAAAAAYALTRGIIIADTKFEFGTDEMGALTLIDEALTPDSSRFWDAAQYTPGRAQASFDKQFVRDYLERLDWNKQPPAPPLPPEIVAATTERYLAAYRTLTDRELAD